MKPTVAIIIPSHDMVHMDFVSNLIELTNHAACNGIGFGIFNPRSSNIESARNQGVQMVRDHTVHFSHILFIDSDQMFPTDGLKRLLETNRLVVGASSVTRTAPIEYTARGDDGKRLPIQKMSGVIRVKSNGFPFMLINTRVFHTLSFPWFQSGYDADGKFVSEDEYFCHKVSEDGTDVFVDADMSKEIGHIGIKIYTIADCEG